MAKKANNPERLVYCSGPLWEGDGSKSSSACHFGESITTTASRFKCHNCAVGVKPSDFHADRNGFIGKRKDLTMSNAQNDEKIHKDNKAAPAPVKNINQVELRFPENRDKLTTAAVSQDENCISAGRELPSPPPPPANETTTKGAPPPPIDDESEAPAKKIKKAIKRKRRRW